MEKQVKGATKVKLAAPKSKYVEPILSATRGGETGVADIFNTLQLRLRDSTWTIVFKALILVHLMIREGAPDVTLRFLADSPKRLAISQFTEAQTQGSSIRRYFEYLLEKVKAYQATKIDFVLTGAGHMKTLTVERGLLRQTEIVQLQIKALIKCDMLGGTDPDNEISMTAFRLLTMDLLELFRVMNEGTINVLEHYFEMSKVDAKRALDIYKVFARQTDLVVQYLSTARQYQAHTRLEVPKLKHAPTTLTSSLEDYLNDPDFDINRRQYLAQQEAKRTGRPVAAVPTSRSVQKPELAAAAPAHIRPVQSQPPPRAPAPDLIDFFESIEQNQQPMAQQAYPQQQAPPQQMYPQEMPSNQMYPQAEIYAPQQQPVPQQTGYNPFARNLGQTMPQQLQPDFTGAGFGGYGPQPLQNSQPMFGSQLTTIPQESVADFHYQSSNGAQQMQSPSVQSPQLLQPQQTGTNPFRQSMIQGGNTVPNRQSTNPFARQPTGMTQPQQVPATSVPPPFLDQPLQQQFSPMRQESPIGGLQPQKTGTNPFARTPLSPPPITGHLTANVTGSTNPFRQSQFVNQQTGQGWQHTTQGTISGHSIADVPTTAVFPRPGA